VSDHAITSSATKNPTVPSPQHKSCQSPRLRVLVESCATLFSGVPISNERLPVLWRDRKDWRRMTTVVSTISQSPRHLCRARRRHSVLGITAAALAVVTTVAMSIPAEPADAATETGAGRTLQEALNALVSRSDGPPGVIAVVTRGATQTVYRAGTAQVGQSVPLESTDHIRLASVSKAYSGAVALSLVADHVLSLSDTVGKWLPSLPGEWHGVTLAELLQHTSGIRDFSGTTRFVDELLKDPQNPQPPETLLSYASPDLMFTPGSDYHYSNSDNIIVALMVQAATGQSYESELQSRVLGPLGLSQTSLPQGSAIPSPSISGYDPDPPKAPSDVTSFFAAGWSWASGGVIATPQDLTTFIRAYVRGATTSRALHEAQFTFRQGSSEPPGPGTNSAGLAVFRYKTSCGTVYGHTGNTLGYTTFAAATASGSRSVTVQINAQITPTVNKAAWLELRRIYELGVCAAIGH
jgi:D-alanyl-D-alanine carboxypeptidase